MGLIESQPRVQLTPLEAGKYIYRLLSTYSKDEIIVRTNISPEYLEKCLRLYQESNNDGDTETSSKEFI